MASCGITIDNRLYSVRVLNIREERSFVLSTLTKVLVVLVSLISIFLCGIVVTYVANSSNYKELYTQEQKERQLVEAERLSVVKQYNAQLDADKKVKDELNDRISILDEDKSNLEADYRNVQRESASYEARATSLQGALTGFEQTISNLVQSLNLARGELDNLRTDRVDEKKEFNQITARLYEAIVQMEALSADKRRLLEERTGLEATIEELAGGKGASAGVDAKSNVVTREKSSVSAVGVGIAVNLNGLITEVGESLVSVSIGSADGVTKNMVFHVTRGDEFICDIVVTDVDTNKAAGVVELKLQQPRIGDSITTNM